MGVKVFKSGDIVIKINHDKCNGDGACIDACPSEVFELKGGKSVAVRVEDCVEGAVKLRHFGLVSLGSLQLL